MTRTMSAHDFSVLADAYAVVRLRPQDPVPPWALASPGFTCITRTVDEISIVCRDADAPLDGQASRGWVILRLHGPFPHAQVGVLASFAVPLAEARISIFALSTFDTDYILIKASQLQSALRALAGAGHTHVA